MTGPLAASDPGNADAQRDLSISQNKIGDVLVAQGDGPGALVAYRRGLAIREALAARDPANTQWQTDVAVSCAKARYARSRTELGGAATLFASRKRGLGCTSVYRAVNGHPGLDPVV